MDIPILIITYNRFNFVQKILNKLYEHNFKNVYIAVDDYHREAKSFDEIELFLISEGFQYKLLKWPKNVGCENNVLDSIKWFFDHVERGIIFEDDCIPSNSFFEMIPQIEHLKLVDKNISFFSNYLGSKPGFFLRPSYIPFFWGWYTSRDFFNEFYKFIKGNSLSIVQIKRIFSSSFTLKTKLIILINYLSFNYSNGGTGWDSVMFFYQVVHKRPFYVPSHSLIDNIGFGSLNSLFTHTDQMPEWCHQIRKKNDIIVVAPNISSSEINEDRVFLNNYYKEYPGSFKLFITFVIKFLERKIKGKIINTQFNV